MKEKRHAILMTVVLFVLALAAAGCPAKKPAAPAVGRPSDADIVALHNQTRFKTRAELRDYIASRIVCPIHNLDLLADEKSNPDCPARSSFLVVVDRMIDTGWTLEEIETSLNIFKQGRSLFETMRNEQSCVPGPGKIKLDFFLMSQCPYGMRYDEQILPAMVADLGESLVWEPHFIVDFDQSGNMKSLHGQPEIEEDQYQICIAREKGNDAWMQYAQCYAVGLNQARANAQQAGKAVDMATLFKSTRDNCLSSKGIDKASVEKCVAQKSKEYLRKDKELVDKWGTAASPSAVYNCNTKFQGGATPYEIVKPFICRLYEPDKQPAACRAPK